MATINVSFEIPNEDLLSEILFVCGGDKEKAQRVLQDIFHGRPLVIDFTKMTEKEKFFTLQGTVANIMIGVCNNEEWAEREAEQQQPKSLIIKPT